VARVDGTPDRAARLLGAAQALRDTIRRRFSAGQARELDAEVALLRAALGGPAFAAAWAEGRAMSLEQAVAYALDEQPSA
jgi:hypothetical protein